MPKSKQFESFIIVLCKELWKRSRKSYLHCLQLKRRRRVMKREKRKRNGAETKETRSKMSYELVII